MSLDGERRSWQRAALRASLLGWQAHRRLGPTPGHADHIGQRGPLMIRRTRAGAGVRLWSAALRHHRRSVCTLHHFPHREFNCTREPSPHQQPHKEHEPSQPLQPHPMLGFLSLAIEFHLMLGFPAICPNCHFQAL